MVKESDVLYQTAVWATRLTRLTQELKEAIDEDPGEKINDVERSDSVETRSSGSTGRGSQ